MLVLAVTRLKQIQIGHNGSQLKEVAAKTKLQFINKCS
jgi:GTPase Era involved in 16S rRNA processing